MTSFPFKEFVYTIAQRDILLIACDVNMKILWLLISFLIRLALLPRIDLEIILLFSMVHRRHIGLTMTITIQYLRKIEVFGIMDMHIVFYIRMNKDLKS